MENKIKCIIEGTDFYDLPIMKYYAPPASWSAEKEKENAINKIFSGEWWGAQKRDGIFTMCGKNLNGEIFLRPRAKNTKGEFVNKVDWVPQIHDFLQNLKPGTVLLGELYLPRDEQAKSTSSIMNSLQPRALKRQEKEEDKLHLYVFDILADRSESYLNMKAIDRFLTLDDYSKSFDVNFPYVEWAHYVNGQELWNLLQNLLADGYEGVVITYQDAPYQPGKRSNKVSLKIKKKVQETIDCVIMGSNPPAYLYTGKEVESWPYWFDTLTNQKILASEYFLTHHESIYKLYSEGGLVEPVTKTWFYGWAGSLKLGLYKDDKLIHVGDLSGITDEIRQNWKSYVDKVVEITCMEIHDTGGLRHPRMLGFRNDKAATDCTIDQIK